MNRSDGFTLAEVLVGLFALSITLLIALQIAVILRQYPKELLRNEDQIGIEQLQLLFAEASEITVEDQQINFSYRSQQVQISFHHQRLVKQPGYEIFLKDIEEGMFYEKQGCFYAEWQRDTSSTAILGCQ